MNKNSLTNMYVALKQEIIQTKTNKLKNNKNNKSRKSRKDNKTKKDKNTWEEACKKVESIVTSIEKSENITSETLLELCTQTLILITFELPNRILNEDKEGFEKIDNNLTRYYETIQDMVNVVILNEKQLDILYNNILTVLNTYITMNIKIENTYSNDDSDDDSDHKACNPKFFSNYKFNFNRLLRLLDQRFYKCKLSDYIKHSIELSNEERATRMFCINCNSRYDEIYLKTPSTEQNIEQSIVV